MRDFVASSHNMDSAPTPEPGAAPGTAPTGWSSSPGIPDRRGLVLGGRFEIRDLIAKGGMSEVWRAKDLHARGQGAIKIFRKDRPDARPRFAVEAEVLSRLDHPHIVGLLDYGHTTCDDRLPFIALKLIAGENLGTALVRRGRLPWRDVVEIGVQLGDALHALHQLGVIHRDVKPLNVMQIEGTELRVKLIDLGLCKLTDKYVETQSSPPYRRRLTGLDFGPLGTKGYIPPEAAEQGQTVLGDVYALGVTLYQLLTGAMPQSLGHAPIEGDVPPDLSRLILSALAEDPAERLPSADHVRRGLEAIRIAHPEIHVPSHLFAGKYDRMQVLGVGAHSQTFAAYDRQIERMLALKVIRTDKTDVDDQIRFVRAAKVLGLLRHPNVPAIHEVGSFDGQMYAAVELCHGTMATELARPSKHLGPEAVISIGLQLADVLGVAHAAGIVYRDLHMGNVLVDRRGEEPKAWLFDFDHAQLSPVFWNMLPQRWATPPEQRRDPAHEKPLANMDYAAPEVRRGDPFTPASDVFALGLCLYRLLTGMRPFPPAGGEMVPAIERCECPDALDMLLTQMLRARPELRPSVEQVREQLEDAREELAAELEPQTERERPATSAAPPAEPVASTAPPAGLAAAHPAPPTAAPIAEPASPSRRVWPRLARGAALAAALLLAWSLGQVQGRRGHDVPANVADQETPPVESPPVEPRPVQATGLDPEVKSAGAELSDPLPVAASVEEALEALEPSLHTCATQAGRLVTVELTAGVGATRFDTIGIMIADPAVDRCFRDALEPVRFAPQPSAVSLFPGYQP